MLRQISELLGFTSISTFTTRPFGWVLVLDSEAFPWYCAASPEEQRLAPAKISALKMSYMAPAEISALKMSYMGIGSGLEWRSAA